jgi:hypothetical protein
VKFRALIWVLFCLVFGVIIVQAGRYGYSQNHGMNQYGPSGTSAFVELLNQAGYKVKKAPLAPTNTNAGKTFIAAVEVNRQEKVTKYLKKLPKDSKVILFLIPASINTTRTKSVTNSDTDKPIGSIIGVSSDDKGSFWEGIIDEEEKKDERKLKRLRVQGESVSLLFDGGDNIAEGYIYRGRTVVVYREGGTIINEHIDKADNASLAMSIVNRIATKDEPVTVIAQFASSDDDPSLIQALGPFVHGAWNQLGILLAIMFVGFCVRFGFAELPRVKQRSSKELADGVAVLFRNKKQGNWALASVLESTLRDLESRHRVHRDELLKVPNAYISNEDAQAIFSAMSASQLSLLPEDALAHVKRLQRLV